MSQQTLGATGATSHHDRQQSSSTAAADALIPADHPFAHHLAATRTAPEHRGWSSEDGALPAMFLSHGAPPLLEEREWMTQLHGWAHSMPRPRAILIVSAHWESHSIAITSTRPREMVYDFGGFDPLYGRMRYDTPDASWLAERVRAVLPDGRNVHEHTERGIDHGAWVPLKAMFPEADVPVLQLSLPAWDPERLMELGAQLKSLRAEGVLLIGSGFMTHGLPFIDWRGTIPGWSRDFDQWAAEALAAGDVDQLQRYRSTAPALQFAHPTPEHFTPLFVTLGAAEDPTAAVQTTVDGFWLGLAKRSFQVA